MGYVLLQYHEEIGYSVDYDFFMEHKGDTRKKKSKKPEDELKTGLAVLMKTGKYQEAVQRVRPYILEDNPDLELSEKFLQLLKMTGEHEKAANYSIKHFEVLVKNNKKQKATELFPEVQKSPAGPPPAECVAKVASWFEDLSEYKKALATYVYFTKQYKKHPLMPDVYYQLAKLLHEHADNSGKAKQILKGIIKTWPQHKRVPEATKYLASLS
jgi:tetratricopeptide (TPR) repeat protein